MQCPSADKSGYPVYNFSGFSAEDCTEKLLEKFINVNHLKLIYIVVSCI